MTSHPVAASPRVLVVGAGFAGSVVARVLADAGIGVSIVEKRDHIAGNAFDRYDDHGVLVHHYGPHIFHTRSRVVLEFLSRFTDWRFYEHRVLAMIGDKLLPVPINRTTIATLLGREISTQECEEFLASQRVRRARMNTSEDVVLSSVGPLLGDLFFRGYTRKQWGRELSELSAGVAARIPTRSNDDDRYFEDEYQFMPAGGYTAMFERMLDHRLIDVQLKVDFFTGVERHAWRHIVYTGPVDAYFDYCYGKLPYRSLRFVHEHYADHLCQPVATINFPNDYDYTRQTEFKHLTGQIIAGTSIVREFSSAEGEPFYPVPTAGSHATYARYKKRATSYEGVTFVGRLAQYRYYNMDQVVAAALDRASSLVQRIAPAGANGQVRQQGDHVDRMVSALRDAHRSHVGVQNES